MNIILIGAQGAGKGTQAQLLAEKYGWSHLSTGRLYREAVHKKEPFIMKIQESVDNGGFIPDKIVLKLVKENLSDKGNLFDGIPRTLEQAEALDEFTQIDLVVELKLSDKDSVKRLAQRRECTQCRAIFGAENPPRKEGVCNRCGGKVIQRADDKPEAIKKRLKLYHELTEPLLEYYKPRKIVHSVDASKNIDTVFKDVCKVIESAGG